MRVEHTEHSSRSQNSTWTLRFRHLSDSLTLYTLICQKKRDHPPSEVFSQKTALEISGLDHLRSLLDQILNDRWRPVEGNRAR